METRQYPPTCQFFTSALSILGQQFLPNMPNQSLQVLQLIKDQPALADLLVPLYDPNLSLDHFTSQYKEVVEQSEDQSKLAVVFSLITKVMFKCVLACRIWCMCWCMLVIGSFYMCWYTACIPVTVQQFLP